MRSRAANVGTALSAELHLRCAHYWRAPTCRRSSRPRTRSRSAARSAWRAPAAAGCARNTSKQPPGSEATRPRISSRSRRFTRLRTTAEPTARLTTKPTFGSASSGTGPAASSRCAGQGRATGPAARAHRALELLRAPHPRLLRQHDPSSRRRSASWPAKSDGELLAALAAARGKDGAAGTGTHPLAETVDLGPPTVVRLERTLAHWNSRSLGTTVLNQGQACRALALKTWAPRTWLSLLTVRVIYAQVKPGRSAA